MGGALHWFRRDLRLEDNTALNRAFAVHEWVLPVYIFEEEISRGDFPGTPRGAFLVECLKSLARDIAEPGGKLLCRRGRPEVELAAIVKETGAGAVYFNEEIEPAGRERDSRVTQHLQALGIDVFVSQDASILGPESVLKEDGTPYKVFTPYKNFWLSQPRPKPSARKKVAFLGGTKLPMRLDLPTPSRSGHSMIPMIPAGEAAAGERLRQFCEADVGGYAENRDFPARDLTSRLSPHLALGTISARTVMAAVEGSAAAGKNRARGSGPEVFVSELIWRDFYRQILRHFPHAARSSFKPAYDGVRWENDEKHFAAWREGRTGYPLVDAAMRQLNATGWMHNRLRMIVATFLTKDLLISWQWGERYFMEKLYDGDMAANNGGWQWSAGTGTDAQPYFRIFNPTAQAEKFDPEGRFIRKYVPEVDTGDYPRPIVEHAQQRLKALAMYKRATG